MHHLIGERAFNQNVNTAVLQAQMPLLVCQKLMGRFVSHPHGRRDGKGKDNRLQSLLSAGLQHTIHQKHVPPVQSVKFSQRDNAAALCLK